MSHSQSRIGLKDFAAYDKESMLELFLANPSTIRHIYHTIFGDLQQRQGSLAQKQSQTAISPPPYKDLVSAEPSEIRIHQSYEVQQLDGPLTDRGHRMKNTNSVADVDSLIGGSLTPFERHDVVSKMVANYQHTVSNEEEGSPQLESQSNKLEETPSHPGSSIAPASTEVQSRAPDSKVSMYPRNFATSKHSTVDAYTANSSRLYDSNSHRGQKPALQRKQYSALQPPTIVQNNYNI